MKTIQEITEAIITSDLTVADMDKVFEAYKTKVKLIRERNKAMLTLNLSVGDTVKTGKMTPKRFSYITGKVVSIRGQRVDVEAIDAPSWEISKGQLVRGVPMSALTAV